MKRSEKDKQAQRQLLKAIIAKHGSAYKAALAEGVTPSAFYCRMKAVDLPRSTFLLKGEPVSIMEKKVWLEDLLKGRTVRKVAKMLDSSPTAIHVRMKHCGISKANHGAEPAGLKTREERVEWLRELLNKHGSGCKVARFLGVSEQAIYERMKRYGLKMIPVTEVPASTGDQPAVITGAAAC